MIAWLCAVALAIDPVRYAELLNFEEDSVVDRGDVGRWTKNGVAYCASPLTSASSNSTRANVWAVGTDCCGTNAAPQNFSCFAQEAFVASPGGQGVPTAPIGLKVPHRLQEKFLKAASRSPVWWQGRQEFSPPPLLVYAVGRTSNRCAVEALDVCETPSGNGTNATSTPRNIDACPLPITRAFDLRCPRLAQCFRNWDGEEFSHSCIERPREARYLADSELGVPDWWDTFTEKHPGHPAAGPGSPPWPAPREMLHGPPESVRIFSAPEAPVPDFERTHLPAADLFSGRGDSFLQHRK